LGFALLSPTYELPVFLEDVRIAREAYERRVKLVQASM
jgi:hypothetical protein